MRPWQLSQRPCLACDCLLPAIESLGQVLGGPVPQVRSLAPLSALGSTQLTELYVACNKVTAIESLAALPQLQVLELGGNRIRVLEGGAGRGQVCCWVPPSPP